MKIFITILLLISLNGFSGNVVFPPVIVVEPDVINTNTEVLAGVDANQTCLLLGPNSDGVDHHVEIDGSNIQLTFIGAYYSPCTVIPVADYYYYNLGTLPEGEYTITFYRTPGGTLPVDPDDPNVIFEQFSDPITFGVSGIPVVPSMSVLGFFLMAITFVLVALYKIKKKRYLIVSVFLLFTFQVDAALYHVLLSGDPNAPTADEVQAESLISPPPPSPILGSFITARPAKVETLVSNRVTGHFLDLINNNPDWSYSKLYRYLVLTYPDGVDEQFIKNTLLADQFIDNVFLIEGDPSIVPLRTPSGNEINQKIKSNKKSQFSINSHLTDLNIISAWELSEGSGYIGAVDVGIQVDHPSFRAFDDSGNYLGGNLLEASYQYDNGEGDYNIDSAEPTSTNGDPGKEGCDLADGIDDDLAVPTFTGHGTHMAGLMVAKNGNVSGICKNCGLAMVKFYSHNRCLFTGSPTNEYWWLLPILNLNSPELAEFEQRIADGLSNLTNIGMGVTNYSGGRELAEVDYCTNNPNYPICLAIQHADEHNVLITGATGNNRTFLQLPASDSRTAAVGGLHNNGNFWNESPYNGDYTSNQSVIDCPYPTSNDECGSNKSFPNGNSKTDIVTQARSVYSTFYEGGRHNHLLGDTSCTDDMDGVPNDGYGICTGTSMASPQAASIFQLMRSAHPLLPNGDADPNNLVGLRNILNYASNRGQAINEHDDYFGYGLPDARLALEIVLGKSNGTQIKTRLTPMFVNHSSIAKNTVYTPFPQVSTAFLISNSQEYLPDTTASLVNEFTDFWYDNNILNFPAPRANFYVFTTNNNPSVNLKNMVPLRRMDKTINGNNRNDTYAVSDAEIEAFHNDGYNYAGIEGYIFPICLSEPGCVPFGAHKLYRVEDSVNFNHKLINLPKTDPPPPNSTKLGYVYPNIDTDGDGLIDGQEFVLGTSHTVQDTDGDGLNDGFEYPPAGVPFSDPLISDIIFEDGFE